MILVVKQNSTDDIHRFLRVVILTLLRRRFHLIGNDGTLSQFFALDFSRFLGDLWPVSVLLHFDTHLPLENILLLSTFPAHLLVKEIGSLPSCCLKTLILLIRVEHILFLEFLFSLQFKYPHLFFDLLFFRFQDILNAVLNRDIQIIFFLFFLFFHLTTINSILTVKVCLNSSTLYLFSITIFAFEIFKFLFLWFFHIKFFLIIILHQRRFPFGLNWFVLSFQ
jgi:hypothetical protein